MAIGIRKAARKFRPLKIGIGGVSGSGKTYGALKLAYGICGNWERICVLDTENASADLYAHFGDFSVIEPENNSPDGYLGAIREVVDAGVFEVLIIDSLTHEWSGPGGLLEIVDKLQDTGKGGNSFTVWGKATPMHNAFVASWLGLKMHVIGTLRKKDEYVIEQNDKGRATPKKVGLKNIQRDGLDYEFDLLFDIHQNHHVTVSKDRTLIFGTRPPFMITEKTGQDLARWSQATDIPSILPQNVVAEDVPPPIVHRAPPSPTPPCADVPAPTQTVAENVFRGEPQQIDALTATLGRMGIDPLKYPLIFEKMMSKSAAEFKAVVEKITSAP